MPDTLAALIEQHYPPPSFCACGGCYRPAARCACGAHISDRPQWAAHLADRVCAVGAAGRPAAEGGSPPGSVGVVLGQWDGQHWWIGDIPAIGVDAALAALPDVREQLGGHMEAFALYQLHETSEAETHSDV